MSTIYSTFKLRLKNGSLVDFDVPTRKGAQAFYLSPEILEKEPEIMKHKLWFDTESEMLLFQIIGDYSTEEARESELLFERALGESPVRQLLVDLSKAGAMESRETRKIQNDSIRRTGITDTAFVGATATTRMIARVMTKLGAETIPTQFFATTDEAIAWLKNQRGGNTNDA